MIEEMWLDQVAMTRLSSSGTLWGTPCSIRRLTGCRRQSGSTFRCGRWWATPAGPSTTCGHSPDPGRGCRVGSVEEGEERERFPEAGEPRPLAGLSLPPPVAASWPRAVASWWRSSLRRRRPSSPSPCPARCEPSRSGLAAAPPVPGPRETLRRLKKMLKLIFAFSTTTKLKTFGFFSFS